MDDYEMLNKAIKYDLLINALFNESELSYRKDSLYIDRDASDLLSIFEPKLYEKRYKELQELQENKEE